jgi:hypothetical protein
MLFLKQIRLLLTTQSVTSALYRLINTKLSQLS